jgi:hypothetical protein
MPIKGCFTACVCVLFDQPPSVDALASVLADSGHEVVKRVEPGEQWQFRGSSLVIAYRPEVNGYVSLDGVDHPWPDAMGDPQSDPLTFGAWTMGHFGPFTFPGGLQRAAQQSWFWPEARAAVEQHGAFVRLLASYVFGGGRDTPLFPEDYNPIDELHFLLGAVAPVLGLSGALAFFNPNGEVLRPAEQFHDSVRWAREHHLPPLDVLANVRLFNVDEGWLVRDTVGVTAQRLGSSCGMGRPER